MCFVLSESTRDTKGLIVRKTLFLCALFIFNAGCNVNESKEARIQKLESLHAQTKETIAELEARIVTLESQAQINDK